MATPSTVAAAQWDASHHKVFALTIPAVPPLPERFGKPNHHRSEATHNYPRGIGKYHTSDTSGPPFRIWIAYLPTVFRAVTPQSSIRRAFTDHLHLG